MKPIFGKDFAQHLKEVIAIDSVTLPAEYVTSLEKLEERFHTFEDSFVGMLDDTGRLVGYINYFPLQEPTRERLVQGEIPNDIFLGKTRDWEGARIIGHRFAGEQAISWRRARCLPAETVI